MISINSNKLYYNLRRKLFVSIGDLIILYNSSAVHQIWDISTHIAVKMREILRSFIACHSQLGLIGPLFGFYHTSLKWIELGRDMKTESSCCCISHTLLMHPFTSLHNRAKIHQIESVLLCFSISYILCQLKSKYSQKLQTDHIDTFILRVEFLSFCTLS